MSLSYNTSISLSELLTQLASKTEYHLKNSHLAEVVKDIKLEEDKVLPIQEAMNIICERLEEDTTLAKRMNLSANNIIQLLQFTMSTTYFSFKGKLYEQTFGKVMGRLVSIVVANLYMEWWEQTALATSFLN